ncbi:hypothetical protein [Shewanella ulleungensis]|uniref:hypothetical protein n=1 Tax=Shewanella ulleungensis TaxID=2282699 RepID=UPI003D79E71F
MAVENSVVIWQGKTKDIEFSYTDFKGNKSRRNVSVNKVLFDAESESFYINGICNERKAERDFKESNISTMIKVGSHRYDFQEWMLTLDVDISEWLDKRNTKISNEPTDLPTEKLSFTDKVEEYNRKQKIKLDELKANKAIKPSKVTSNKFINVLFWIGVFIAPYIFAWFTLRKGSSTKSKVISFSWLFVFVMANILFPNKNKDDLTNKVQPIEVKTVEVKIDKYKQFNDLTDCQLSKLIIADYEPMIMSLSQYLGSNDNLTYQQVNNWKNATNFQSNLDGIKDKYPTIQRVDMHNSRLASGFDFRISQVIRDTISSLRKSNNQGHVISPQWEYIQNEVAQIAACKENS